MKRKAGLGLTAFLAVIMLLSACGGGSENKTTAASPASGAVATATPQASAAPDPKAEKRTIKYLDKEYTVPAKAERIVMTGSMESMEDAVVLGVEPIGGITVGGKFPAIFSSVTGKTESIGEKSQPNLETIVKLKPDVILSTTKFPAETAEKLGKIAVTIPVSHIASDWEANLRLLGELTGKRAEAEKKLQEYKTAVEAFKGKPAAKLQGQKVVAVRIRQGNLYIYPTDVFFNASLYEDFGLAPPSEVKAAKAQEAISLEKFAEMNPDYVFLQFDESENKDKPKSLEELQNNPIWNKINAAKNNRVFVNVVDPLAQGGTAWSKLEFLKAVQKLLG